MSGQFAIQFSAVQAATDNIEASTDALTQNLNDLHDQVSTSLGQWEGSARRAYREAKQTWDQHAAEMDRLLRRTRTTLQQSNDTYMTTERSNTAMWETN